MPFFRHEGNRLAYTIYGDGPRTLVLVHGLLLSQKMHRPWPVPWPNAATGS